MRSLTPKQRFFVREYLIDLNSSAAARRAGYKHGEIGRRLVTKSHVLTAIEKEMRRRAAKLDISAERVLAEIAKIAFSDARKLFDANGDLIPIHLLDDDTAATIAGIEVTEIETGEEKPLTRIKKIKRWDKTKNLELLGRHLALFTDKIIAKVDLDIDAILRDLSGSTRGLPSMMPRLMDGGKDD